MDPKPRLACQQCKQRKIRCDKGTPCSACSRSGLSCHVIQRARLPRGRTAKTRSANTNIETRIVRIEHLLEEYNQKHALPLHPSAQIEDHPVVNGNASVGTASNARMDDFVAPDFWKLLSEEISGLRETLESGNEDDKSLKTDPTPEPDDDASRAGAILFRHPILHAPFYLPSATAQAKLLEIYRFRVESAYKLFHWPTLMRTFEQNQQPKQTSVPVRALQFSIIFMAYCAITNEEAVAQDLGDRIEMLALYQSATEDMLARSQLLLGPDLITLQAFVVYLHALRTCSNSATTWTLLAIAVRAATALRLSKGLPSNASTVDRELRRRLLFAIGILDSHASMDRGTVPMVPLSEFQSPPLDINDSDLSSASKVPMVGSPGFTDMTHTKLVYAAMLSQRKLYELSSNADGTDWSHWPKMVAVIDDLKQHVENDLCRFKAETGPLVMHHIECGPKILVSLELFLRRPSYRSSRNIVPPWDDMNILEAATTVLEEHLKPMPAELAPWAWKSWVQWHALAVVLAELLVQPYGSLFDRAYAAARKGFSSYTTLIADGDSGMLWKPIARLMHRVQRLRQPPLQEVQRPSTLPNTALALQPNDSLPQEASAVSETFSFDTWDFQLDDTSLFPNADYQSYEQLDNLHAPRENPWLAWDCFLEDLNFPGP
ncbi:hypothetical protein DPSP01_009894 [Paraphaeosphaeria sporulosa]|uniref:Zn(2)-C6 fungal-type domain-containing protein n=1 Tax=Paraphaeosphaeria sporulosa TaxID=1460663 RepID=A0A177BZJ5_9PLEO|nr:uncharacterized protein CC84DRAFT_1156001 [Paraphaeosphaeria sporulosa]OAG00012.1 hypothetical protein CC84DRAFT_1156001 [Paraphaeosphaeria sporulosa]